MRAASAGVSGRRSSAFDRAPRLGAGGFGALPEGGGIRRRRWRGEERPDRANEEDAEGESECFDEKESAWVKNGPGAAGRDTAAA